MPLDLRLPGEGDQEFQQRAEQMAGIARVLVDAALANHCIQNFIADAQLPMWTEASQRRSPTIRLEYEQAIGYLSRYVAAVPADAKAATACEPPPQEDKANVLRRISVLSNLTAKVYIETNPPDATITLANDGGTKAFGKSRSQIDVLGGRYEMTVDRDGFESDTRTIEVSIGKPYTTYVELEPLKGTLSIQVTPSGSRRFSIVLFNSIRSSSSVSTLCNTTLPAEKWLMVLPLIRSTMAMWLFSWNDTTASFCSLMSTNSGSRSVPANAVAATGERSATLVVQFRGWPFNLTMSSDPLGACGIRPSSRSSSRSFSMTMAARF